MLKFVPLLFLSVLTCMQIFAQKHGTEYILKQHISEVKTFRSDSNAARHVVSHKFYNDSGNLTKEIYFQTDSNITDTSGVYLYTYDSLNRLVTIIHTDTNNKTKYLISYSYLGNTSLIENTDYSGPIAVKTITKEIIKKYKIISRVYRNNETLYVRRYKPNKRKTVYMPYGKDYFKYRSVYKEGSSWYKRKDSLGHARGKISKDSNHNETEVVLFTKYKRNPVTQQRSRCNSTKTITMTYSQVGDMLTRCIGNESVFCGYYDPGYCLFFEYIKW